MRLTFILLAVLLIFVVTFMEVTVAFITKIVVRTAPKDIQERILVRPDNPKWKTAIGIISDVMILLCILGIFIISGVDAVKNNML